MSPLKLGVDVGNFSTKSRNTIITSGYERSATKPTIQNKYLLHNNSFYVPSSKILAYQKDKTTNERAITLTLMSIGEELIFRKSKGYSPQEMSKRHIRDNIQKELLNIKSISLGVGLPPTHYTEKYIYNLTNYYEGYMKNGIQFTYYGYDFDFKMHKCRVFPQAGAAGLCVNEITKYSAYYVIDIGGYTVDTMYFEDNEPVGNKFSSKELGVLILYDNIIDRVTVDFDMTINTKLIEDVLRGRNTVIPQEVKDSIMSMTKSYCDNIINTLKESGIEFKAYPCLFMGGGSLLMEPYILDNPIISPNTIHFLSDVKANAIAYEKML